MKSKIKLLVVIFSTFVGTAVLFTNALPLPPGPPLITQQPYSQPVEPGASATFSVQATGTGNLSYFWQFNGTPIPGANSSSFTIPQTRVSNLGEYSVEIYNSVGKITSRTVNLRFKGAEFPINSRWSSLYHPNGIGIDSNGTLYVSDWMNKRVVAISSANRVIRQLSVKPNPTGLVLSNNFVYVNLTNNGQVTYNGLINKYDLSLNLIASYSAPFVASSFAVQGSMIYAAARGTNSLSTVYKLDTKLANPSWTRVFDVAASRPNAMALNSRGHFYIGDSSPGGNTLLSWVKEFDGTGRFLKQLQIPSNVTSLIPGDAPINYFANVSALKVDSRDQVLVGDSFGRALTFSSAGEYLGQIYPQLPIYSKLQGATAIELDASGNRYIASSTSIKAFSPDGTFLREFGSAGLGAHRLAGPKGLSIGVSNTPMRDNLYVVDQLNGSVKAFAPNGMPLFQINNDLTWADGSKTVLLSSLLPYQADVSLDGSVYVHWSGNYTTISGGETGVSYSGVILKYDNLGKPAREMFGLTTLDGPYALDPKGYIYMLNPALSRIDIYQMSAGSTKGTPLARVDLKNKSGKVIFPEKAFSGNLGSIRKAIFRDAKSNYYVYFYDSTLTPNGSRILKFNSFGVQVAEMAIEGWTGDVAVDSVGHIYATCGYSLNKICVFNPDGSSKSSFGIQGISVGQFWFASAITVDSMDNILVADFINNRVTKFSPDGEPMIH